MDGCFALSSWRSEWVEGRGQLSHGGAPIDPIGLVRVDDSWGARVVLSAVLKAEQLTTSRRHLDLACLFIPLFMLLSSISSTLRSPGHLPSRLTLRPVRLPTTRLFTTNMNGPGPLENLANVTKVSRLFVRRAGLVAADDHTRTTHHVPPLTLPHSSHQASPVSLARTRHS